MGKSKEDLIPELAMSMETRNGRKVTMVPYEGIDHMAISITTELKPEEVDGIKSRDDKPFHWVVEDDHTRLSIRMTRETIIAIATLFFNIEKLEEEASNG